jgi:hypothetical protein
MLAEFHKIDSISGTGPFTVTISPPLAYTHWTSSQNPQAWWCNTVPQMAYMNGIESLTIDNEVGRAVFYAISLHGAYQSWIKNVRIMNGPRGFVGLKMAANIEIRDSYFYQTIDPLECGTAGTEYGIEAFYVGLVKIENNIFQQVCSALTLQPCFVCVLGYNFTVGDLSSNTSPSWVVGVSHAGAVHNVLLEGNDIPTLNVDHATAEGSSASLLTLFRNRVSGTQPSLPEASSPILNQGYNRFNSYIGNVLGTPGMALAYESSPVTEVTAYPTIYNIGWGCGTGHFVNDCTVPDDNITVTSMMRWGNFDYLSNTVRWESAEVPSGNAVPTTHQLPSSFYLGSEPTWFKSTPWPVIGPDVTSGADASGHAGDIPAKRCYLNVMSGPLDGSGPVLPFNANNC